MSDLRNTPTRTQIVVLGAALIGVPAVALGLLGYYIATDSADAIAEVILPALIGSMVGIAMIIFRPAPVVRNPRRKPGREDCIIGDSACRGCRRVRRLPPTLAELSGSGLDSGLLPRAKHLSVGIVAEQLRIPKMHPRPIPIAMTFRQLRIDLAYHRRTGRASYSPKYGLLAIRVVSGCCVLVRLRGIGVRPPLLRVCGGFPILRARVRSR